MVECWRSQTSSPKPPLPSQTLIWVFRPVCVRGSVFTHSAAFWGLKCQNAEADIIYIGDGKTEWLLDREVSSLDLKEVTLLPSELVYNLGVFLDS